MTTEQREDALRAAREGHPPQVCAWSAGVELPELAGWVKADGEFAHEFHRARASAYTAVIDRLWEHMDSADDGIRFRATQELLREYRAGRVDEIVPAEDVGALERAREFARIVAEAASERREEE